jgi:hypothetical protein
VTNFFLAAFLKASMKHILKMVNAIQIITLNPLLNTTVPSNYLVCLQDIIEISNLKLVPNEVIQWIYRVIKSFIPNLILLEIGNFEETIRGATRR